MGSKSYFLLSFGAIFAAATFFMAASDLIPSFLVPFVGIILGFLILNTIGK